MEKLSNSITQSLEKTCVSFGIVGKTINKIVDYINDEEIVFSSEEIDQIERVLNQTCLPTYSSKTGKFFGDLLKYVKGTSETLPVLTDDIKKVLNGEFNCPSLKKIGADNNDVVGNKVSEIVTELRDGVREITVEGAKTTYTVGDTFDSATGHISVVTYDEDIEEVPLSDSGVEITGFDSSVAVESQVLTVTYKNKQTTYNIVVAEA